MSSARQTSLLRLIEDSQCKFTFDPVDVCNNPPSVAFDVSFEWETPFQSCEMRVRQCWIQETALRQFEQDLSCAIARQRSVVRLADMSDRPLISIELDGNAILRVTAADTVGMGAFSIAMNTNLSSIQEMHRRLREYPKWW